MANKKTTTSFKSDLSKLSKGAFSSARSQSVSQGFKSSAGLTFGKPVSRSALTPVQSSGIDWSGLAKQAVSGGTGSLLKNSVGGGILGSSGLGGIISGIASLFGGHQKKTLPPLQLFQLPNAINQTVHLQNAGASSGSSPAVHVHVQAVDSQSFVNRSNDIARAVKTAMLNSHSLNDVIAEL